MLWKKNTRRISKRTPSPVKGRAFLRVTFVTKLGICVVIIALMTGNIIVLAKSMHLSDNITQLEKDISTTKKENQGLQKKLYAENSLISLEYAAKELGFTKQAEPVFFEKPNYAMAQ